MLPKANGVFHKMQGEFSLPNVFSIRTDAVDQADAFAERISRLGDYAVNPAAPASILQEKQDDLPEEGYRLSISPEGITVSCSTDQGFGYGLTTLYQMLAESSGALPCGSLSDEPAMRHRGLLLDCCRHFVSVEEIKRILEQMSLLKLNHFHWHLSDDQGFRIESEKYPLLNEVGSWRRLAKNDPVVLSGQQEAGSMYGGYYTKAQIRELVAYASARNIEIIPEIDLPGHSSAILAAYPQYTCSGKPLHVRSTFGVHDRIFCAGLEETYTFLFDVLDEIAELFPSPYFHVGGDEAPKNEWHQCPKCNARMKELSITKYDHLQAWFTGRLVKHLEQRGKIAIAWNEAAVSNDLDENAVLQYWAEMGDGESYTVREISRGRKFILSPQERFYCDSFADIPLPAIIRYQPVIRNVTIPAENLLGVELARWMEWIATDEELEKSISARMAAVAERAWNTEPDAEDFMRRLEPLLRNPHQMILAVPSWQEITIHGQEALQMIARGMLMMGQRYRMMQEGVDPEEAGMVAAVKPDEEEKPAKPISMRDSIRGFISAKMIGVYTEAEIDQVADMIMAVMAGKR